MKEYPINLILEKERTTVKPCHYSKGCDQEYFDCKACPVRMEYASKQLERQEVKVKCEGY